MLTGVEPINNVIASGGQQGTQSHVYMYPVAPELPSHQAATTH